MKLLFSILLIPFLQTKPITDNCSTLDVKFSYKTQGLSVSFTNRSEGNYDRQLWKFSDGANSTEINPTHIFSKAGLQHFSLTIYNVDGCVKSFEGKVYLFEK